ncbi:MAG: hypothetical protein P8009_03455, partial [Gammaproteobacteria bacterium]
MHRSGHDPALWLPVRRSLGHAGADRGKGGETMANLNDICEDMLASIDRALAAAIVDQDSG